MLIKLIYSGVDTVALDGSFETYDDDPTYRGLEVDVPLERHSNYLAKWNHKIAVKDDATFVVEDWEFATNTKLTPEQEKKYKWLKPDDTVPDGYWIARKETKPGVETYKISIPEVRKRTYSRNRANLLSLMNSDFKKSTPPDTFGYTGEWLQQASTLQKEGSYWVCEQSWLGSKKVDSDLYS